MNSASFIISHGRAGNVKPLNWLKGRVYIVVDDEDDQLEEYKRLYSDVLVFHKSDIEYDWYDNRYHEVTATPARNACVEFAKELKLDCYWVLDDDLTGLMIRVPVNGKLVNKKTADFMPLMEEYLMAAGLDVLSIAHSGAYFGGVNGDVQAGIKMTACSAMLYRTDANYRYESWTVEDAITFDVKAMRGAKGFTYMWTAYCGNDVGGEKIGGLYDLYHSGEEMEMYRVVSRPDLYIRHLDGKCRRRGKKFIAPMIISDRWKK